MDAETQAMLTEHKAIWTELLAVQRRLHKVDKPLGDRLVPIIHALPEAERKALIEEVGSCFLQFRLMEAIGEGLP